jgi:hypothetical protein
MGIPMSAHFLEFIKTSILDINFAFCPFYKKLIWLAKKLFFLTTKQVGIRQFIYGWVIILGKLEVTVEMATMASYKSAVQDGMKNFHISLAISLVINLNLNP